MNQPIDITVVRNMRHGRYPVRFIEYRCQPRLLDRVRYVFLFLGVSLTAAAVAIAVPPLLGWGS